MPNLHTHYPPFGSSLPNRNWSDANRGYIFGFNGKEKDSETASDNFDFGARIYDGRLGRWLSLDPIFNFSQSNYVAFLCSPISIIDPTGETDYYNKAGEWIGTDGTSNNLQRVVIDNKIEKDIKKVSRKGKDYKITVPNESFYELPNKEVLTAIKKTYEETQKDVKDAEGNIIKRLGYYEAATTFDLNDKQTPILIGEEPKSSEKVAEVQGLPSPGKISIHTHPTAEREVITAEEKSIVSSVAEPSMGKGRDEEAFKNYELNIIVGYDVPAEERLEYLASGATVVKDVERTLVVNFFDKSCKQLFSITYEALNRINDGNTGKTKEKYDKKKK
jgi:RHS repeat-associated protein